MQGMTTQELQKQLLPWCARLKTCLLIHLQVQIDLPLPRQTVLMLLYLLIPCILVAHLR